VHAVDEIWRLVIGLSLIPAFGTLYQRLTLPESRNFQLTREAASASGASSISEREKGGKEGVKDSEASSAEDVKGAGDTVKQTAHNDRHGVVVARRAHYKELISYFSTWNHLRVLLGTTLGWFLVDIVFYGINISTLVHRSLRC
jgi:PHS family inorganic phosphate transporter-like MFS transporter